MSKRLPPFFQENWIALSIFGLAVVAAAWFGISILLDVIYFNDPRHQDQDLRGWMTPRYIVMSYDLPRPLVLELLQISPDDPGGRPLRDIAAELDLSLDELTELVRAAAADYREDRS